MTFFSRHFVAAAVLAALALPALAESAPTAAATPAPTAVPAAAAAPAATASTPMARSGPRRMQARHYRQGQQCGAQQPQQCQEQMMAQHAADLKKQLHLTPAQEGDWTSFTSAMAASRNHARLGMQGMEKLTTPERIERMQAILVQRSAELERRGETVKAFYAALTPAQQKTFDAHHGAMHSAMHGPQGQNAAAEPGQDSCHPGMMMGGQRQGMRPMRRANKAAAPVAPAAPAAAVEAK